MPLLTDPQQAVAVVRSSRPGKELRRATKSTRPGALVRNVAESGCWNKGRSPDVCASGPDPRGELIADSAAPAPLWGAADARLLCPARGKDFDS